MLLFLAIAVLLSRDKRLNDGYSNGANDFEKGKAKGNDALPWVRHTASRGLSP